MLKVLSDAKQRVVGTKQVLRAIEESEATLVFLAEDADSMLKQKVKDACAARGIAVEPVYTMQALGVACHIQVGAATAALLKND